MEGTLNDSNFKGISDCQTLVAEAAKIVNDMTFSEVATKFWKMFSHFHWHNFEIFEIHILEKILSSLTRDMATIRMKFFFFKDSGFKQFSYFYISGSQIWQQ